MANENNVYYKTFSDRTEAQKYNLAYSPMNGNTLTLSQTLLATYIRVMTLKLLKKQLKIN